MYVTRGFIYNKTMSCGYIFHKMHGCGCGIYICPALRNYHLSKDGLYLLQQSEPLWFNPPRVLAEQRSGRTHLAFSLR